MSVASFVQGNPFDRFNEMESNLLFYAYKNPTKRNAEMLAAFPCASEWWRNMRTMKHRGYHRENVIAIRYMTEAEKFEIQNGGLGDVSIHILEVFQLRAI